MGRLGEKLGGDVPERINMRRGEVGVEIGLRLPVLVKDEQPRIVGRDMKIVIDAALLDTGGCTNR